MDNLAYLFAGFAVFWAGLFIYLVFLQVRLRSLHRELERLQERLAERDRQAARPRDAARDPARDAKPGPREHEHTGTGA